MFPGVYGFTWDAGNVIFLGIFFTVVAIIISTVLRASLRARRDLLARKTDAIRWREDFHDLPMANRVCRHQISGDLKQRTCPNGFDCRVCELHPKIEEKKQKDAALSWTRLAADDQLFHRGHTWVKKNADGTAVIGLDDLGMRMIGSSDEADLPPVGTEVHVNGGAWRMRRGSNDIRILSPLDGRVVETGSAERGWYLRLAPLGDEFDVRHLLHGDEVRAWTMREMERLQLALGQESVGPALADGGEPVADLPQNYPQADWDLVWGDMFLEP